jgi:dihydroorotate dehydrogenase (NAD+) catalytic subunit
MTSFSPDLTTRIGSLTLKNPVLAASGTFGYGQEFSEIIDLNILGGIVIKGLSLNPEEGNPPSRTVETPCGMLNAIGLANLGLEVFLREKLPFLDKLKTAIIANIYGHTIEEYSAVAEGLKGAPGIAAIEVNISCPNVKSGGLAFGVDPDVAARVTKEVVKQSDKPVIVKLSPNITDITTVATAVEDAGASAISLINTLTGMSIDIYKRIPKLANVTGGLSGPAIRPVALYMVYQVVKAVKIPVIGIGGIMIYRDALEFLIAGAKAVQVGTANFADPKACLHIIDGLNNFCRHHKIVKIKEIIGTLNENP